MKKHILALLLATGLAACERESQQLPFSAVTKSEKTVGSSGAVVSSPAGASVALPSGSVTAGTNVSISSVTPPAATARSGSAASTAFQMEPAGTVLAKPATAELRFSVARRDSAWLVSVVNLTPTGVREQGNSRVDLSSRSVSAPFSQLGTLVVVVPERRALFPVTRRGARNLAPSLASTLEATGTDSVRVNCGDPNNRCENLSVQASDNLMARVDQAALVYPLISGALRVNGTQVAGRINLSGSVRAQLKSGATAENVEIVALIEPTSGSTFTETASELIFTAMRQRVSGSADSGSGSMETVGTLVIPKTSAQSQVTVTRSFDMRNDANKLEKASVSVTFPVNIHQ